MYIPGTVPVKSKVLEILRIKSHTKIEKAYVSNNILGELHSEMFEDLKQPKYIVAINIYTNVSIYIYIIYIYKYVRTIYIPLTWWCLFMFNSLDIQNPPCHTWKLVVVNQFGSPLFGKPVSRSGDGLLGFLFKHRSSRGSVSGCLGIQVVQLPRMEGFIPPKKILPSHI